MELSNLFVTNTFVFDFSHNFFPVGFIYHQLVNVLAILNMLKISMMKTIMQVAW
jgi:hypothetical protein